MLLSKIRRYNTSDNGCNLMASFLDNRYQIVSLENKNSKCLRVHHRVSQGSVLVPLLFLIYINDFPAFMESQILLFAEGTTLINTGLVPLLINGR